MIDSKKHTVPMDPSDLATLLIREVEHLVQKYKLAPQIVVWAIAHRGPNRQDVEQYLDEQVLHLN